MMKLNDVADPENLFFDAIACMFRRVSAVLTLPLWYYAYGYVGVMQQEYGGAKGKTNYQICW